MIPTLCYVLVMLGALAALLGALVVRRPSWDHTSEHEQTWQAFQRQWRRSRP